MKIRLLEKKDINHTFINLFSHLTNIEHKVNYENITIQPTTIVMEHNNSIIGTGKLIIDNKLHNGFKNVGHIEDIVVDPLHQGNGVGKKIILELIKIAKENNCYKIILDCSDKYINFYEKVGFTKSDNINMVMDFRSN